MAGLGWGKVGVIRESQRQFWTRAVRSSEVVDAREFKATLTLPPPAALTLPGPPSSSAICLVNLWERQPNPRRRPWLINELAANHPPINIHNKFVHVMEGLPVPACSRSQRMGIRPQGVRWSVWPHGPRALVLYCPRT